MKNLNRKNELITKNETFLVESFLVISSFFRFRFFIDRKSTRLNSSHDQISYAVFCLKKKTDTDGTSCGGATAGLTCFTRKATLPSVMTWLSTAFDLVMLAAFRKFPFEYAASFAFTRL